MWTVRFAIFLVSSVFLLSAVECTVAPTHSPTSIPPTVSPTPYPTQVLQTRINIFMNIRTEPQYSVNFFKSNYRSSVEQAMVEILQLPHQEVVLGQVLVTDVALINDGKSLVADTQDPVYTLTGKKCTLHSLNQDSVTVKMSMIFENTGYANKSQAFWDISAQMASATDTGRLMNLTNTNIPVLNPGAGLSLLNMSCFSATSADITEALLRSPSPSSAPTILPEAEGAKHYAVAICLSILLFVAMFVMAAGSVVDTRDRVDYELTKIHAGEVTDGYSNYSQPQTNMQFNNIFSGNDITDMAPIRDEAGGAPSPPLTKRGRRIALQDAISVAKSAVPYLEYVQRLDILRALTSDANSGSGDASGVDPLNDPDIVDEGDVKLPWVSYINYICGIHDARYAENIWLQHRWLSCMFYAPNKSRAMRCFCVFYLAVMMLCFDCLLIVHTDILHPARMADTFFVREVVILCCITALVSSSLYGVVETLVYYSFDETRVHMKPLAVDLSKARNAAMTRGRITAGSGNWQSVLEDSPLETGPNGEIFDQPGSIGDGGVSSPVVKRGRARGKSSSPNDKSAQQAQQQQNRGRSLSAQLHAGGGGRRQLVSGAEQVRSASPPKNIPRSPGRNKHPGNVGSSSGSNAQGRKSGGRRVVPQSIGSPPGKLHKTPEFIALMQRAYQGEEYLYSESMVDELLRLQDDILFCRDAIHTACNQNRVPTSASSIQHGPRGGLQEDGDNVDSTSDSMEIAVEEALLAVQFDGMWGLDSQGNVLTNGTVVKDWRDTSHSTDGHYLASCWKACISRFITAYKGEVNRPTETRGVSNALVNLSGDIVRIRRQVMKEQLKLYSEIVAVEPIVSHSSSSANDGKYTSPGSRLHRDMNGVGGTSVEFGFMPSSADPAQLTTHSRVSYLMHGDDVIKHRKRLIQLFHDDTLPPLSAAIVRNQTHRFRWLSDRLFADSTMRIVGVLFILLSLFAMMGWTYYYSFHIINKRQTSILIIFLVWLAIDMLVVETLSLMIRHVVIPSFAHNDVSDVISWLIFNIISKDKERARKASAAASLALVSDRDSNTGDNDAAIDSYNGQNIDNVTSKTNGNTLERLESDSNLRIRPSIHGEVIPAPHMDNYSRTMGQEGRDVNIHFNIGNTDNNMMLDGGGNGSNINDNIRSMRSFNAAKHMFVSVRLATSCIMNRPYLEATAIASFHTLWPKRCYMSEYGARNSFGYYTDVGVNLFSEEGGGSAYTNPRVHQNQHKKNSRNSGASSSVAPMPSNSNISSIAPSVAVSAPAVAQWVPQSARQGNYYASSSLDNKFFSHSKIFNFIRGFGCMLFFYYIDVLPILLQNVLIEYVIWAVVLWLLYLCIYIVNTSTTLIVLPALALLLLLRIILSMLSNKNRMGLSEDEFELEPEIGPAHSNEGSEVNDLDDLDNEHADASDVSGNDDPDYITADGDISYNDASAYDNHYEANTYREDDGDGGDQYTANNDADANAVNEELYLNDNGNSDSNSLSRPYNNSTRRHRLKESSTNEYADTRRAYHDGGNAERNHEPSYYGHTQQMKARQQRGNQQHQQEGVSNDDYGSEFGEMDKRNHDHYNSYIRADKDSGVRTKNTGGMAINDYRQEKQSQHKKVSSQQHGDRGSGGGGKRHVNSAEGGAPYTQRHRTEAMAVAGGGSSNHNNIGDTRNNGRQIFRSNTAHAAYSDHHDIGPVEDIDDGHGPYRGSKGMQQSHSHKQAQKQFKGKHVEYRGLGEVSVGSDDDLDYTHRPYDDNDTPFTEVPTYAGAGIDSAYRRAGDHRGGHYNSASAVTPAIGAGMGRMNNEQEEQGYAKYNPIISPPNATPQLGHKQDTSQPSMKPTAARAAARSTAAANAKHSTGNSLSGMTNSAMKKGEADMKQWAQYEMEHEQPTESGRNLYDDLSDHDVDEGSDNDYHSSDENADIFGGHTPTEFQSGAVAAGEERRHQPLGEREKDRPGPGRGGRSVAHARVMNPPTTDKDKIEFTMTRFGKSN